MSTEALRKQFEAWLIERGWTENHREKTAAGAYWRADLRWMEEAYQAGHAAAAAAAAETAEVGEPVAWLVYLPSEDGQRVYDDMDDLDMVDVLTNNDDAEVTNLYTASQLAAAVAKEREPQMPEGWAFYSADFSSNAADAFKPGSVLLTRTGRNRAAWLAMSEEDQEVNALYASGRGFTLDEAVRAAIHCVDAIRAKEPNDG